MERIKRFGIAVVGGSLVLASNAHAALDFSTTTLDLTPAEQIVTVAVGGLLGIWVIRKVIKVTNRS